MTFPTAEDAERLSASTGFCSAPASSSISSTTAIATFDDFLAALSSRKRKTIRRERRDALDGGVEIECADRRRHHAKSIGTPSSRSTWTPARANGAGPI